MCCHLAGLTSACSCCDGWTESNRTEKATGSWWPFRNIARFQYGSHESMWPRRATGAVLPPNSGWLFRAWGLTGRYDTKAQSALLGRNTVFGRAIASCDYARVIRALHLAISPARIAGTRGRARVPGRGVRTGYDNGASNHSSLCSARTCRYRQLVSRPPVGNSSTPPFPQGAQPVRLRLARYRRG